MLTIWLCPKARVLPRLFLLWPTHTYRLPRPAFVQVLPSDYPKAAGSCLLPSDVGQDWFSREVHFIPTFSMEGRFTRTEPR